MLAVNAKTSGFPVVENRDANGVGKLVGVLTNRDMRFARNLDQPVRDLMTAVENVYQSDDLVTIGDIAPNPAYDITAMKINLERSAYVDVRVFNTMGAQVQQVYNGRMADGEHVMTIDASNLPSGTYATIISVDDRAYAIRLVVQ